MADKTPHHDAAEMIDLLIESGYVVEEFDVDVDFKNQGFVIQNMHVVKVEADDE